MTLEQLFSTFISFHLLFYPVVVVQDQSHVWLLIAKEEEMCWDGFLVGQNQKLFVRLEHGSGVIFLLVDI